MDAAEMFLNLVIKIECHIVQNKINGREKYYFAACFTHSGSH